MNINNINMKKSTLYFIIALGAGIFIGWLIFHSPENEPEKTAKSVNNEKDETIWTCSMHPQIRMHEPGKCPICGMDLIKLEQNSALPDPESIHLTPEAVQLANVQTTTVTRQLPVKEVRLYGKVQVDERLLQSQVSQIPGRIDKLLVNFNGEKVIYGQPLALIYSPKLVTAQQELLEAAKTKQSQPVIYEAAKEKLRQWKLTDSQISSIENSGNVKNVMEILSSTNGIVTSVKVKTGDYVTSGTVLFDIADLSGLWVMFDAYESDLGLINKGDKLVFTVQAFPGTKYTGNITFIDPVIDPLTRVAKVRVEVNNISGKLKPEMFATGSVSANLSEFNNSIVLPRSAVLWTGKRSIVYVRQPGEEPVFMLREVELGPMLGNNYVITEGLKEGEEVVTRGAFSVDAAAQLEGKTSMMNPAGAVRPGNKMEGMEMGNE
jgi:membrane fusion protein, copper/silver efflux system